MAGKDISEKILADYNDVFADIVNVLLFNGEPRIAPDKLRNAGNRSQYKADGKLHEQERDVTKYFTDSNVTISLLGIENQSRPERFMPLRVIGYDGASYRTQLLNKEVTNIFPVVTMILYFGRTHWNYSRHLTELIDLPDDFKPFVSDYEMKNLFEISFLKPEQVLLFRSDFRYVADYFVQTRLHGDYIPAPGELDHVDAVLKLLSVLTGDHRFEDTALKKLWMCFRRKELKCAKYWMLLKTEESKKARSKVEKKAKLKSCITRFIILHNELPISFICRSALFWIL